MLSTSSSIRPYLGIASNIKAIPRPFNRARVRDGRAFPGSGEEPAGEQAERVLEGARRARRGGYFSDLDHDFLVLSWICEAVARGLDGVMDRLSHGLRFARSPGTGVSSR